MFPAFSVFRPVLRPHCILLFRIASNFRAQQCCIARWTRWTDFEAKPLSLSHCRVCYTALQQLKLSMNEMKCISEMENCWGARGGNKNTWEICNFHSNGFQRFNLNLLLQLYHSTGRFFSTAHFSNYTPSLSDIYLDCSNHPPTFITCLTSAHKSCKFSNAAQQQQCKVSFFLINI